MGDSDFQPPPKPLNVMFKIVRCLFVQLHNNLILKKLLPVGIMNDVKSALQLT